MLIVPAIDLLEGGCVQLRQGDFDRARRYGTDAASVAARFEQQGALWIHVVDLDAARGLGNNRDLIAKIRSVVDVRIQVGGGVRTAHDAKALIELGVDAVVVGTTLATHTLEVLEWAERWPSQVVGGIDTRMGKVQVHGWVEAAGAETELIDAVRGSALSGLVYTAVDRDGMLEGPDIVNSGAVAVSSALPVLLSGGISSDEDLRNVSKATHFAGAIVGTAIYEQHVDLPATISELQTHNDAALWVP